MRKLILFFGFIIYITKIFATIYPNFYFKNIEVDMGLSHNMVYAILQDKQGFMWFGTQEGLNRFDGISFKIYKKEPYKKNSLKSNAIFSLLEDKNGIIWIGTDHGISLYDPKLNYFINKELQSNQGETYTGIVRSIVADKNNNIWLSLEDKGIFCINEEETRFYSLEKFLENGKGSIRNLCFDTEENLYIATYQQGLLRLNTHSGKIDRVLSNENKEENSSINSLYLLNPESLLIGTTKGLFRYDLHKKILETIVSKNESGKNLFVRDIYVDKNNQIWLGTETGGYIYSPQGEQIANFKHLPNDMYSLSDNAVHSIYQDRKGDFWIGTFFGGVNYYSKTHSLFEKYYPTTEANSIMGKSISEFSENSDGKIWVGTEDKGLYLFDPLKKTFQKTNVPADNIHTLLQDKNKLWVGSFQEGLFVFDLKTKRIKNYLSSSSNKSLKDNNIYSIYQDSKNTHWIGTMTGLHRYNPEADNFIRTEEKKITSQVNDITEDGKGNLWFATLGQGLFSYDYAYNKWEHIPTIIEEDSIQGKRIICLLEDKSNRLWLGTEGAGLILFNKETKKAMKIYTINEGLPNNVIYRITEDNQGNIWGSTNYGLFCLDPSDNKIKKYTHADGLLGNQFNYKSGLTSSTGKIYFGGIKGFVAFNPQTLVFKDRYPNIVFNNFLVNNYEICTEDESGLLQQSINYTKHIELSHDQSTFSLDFAVLDYSYPNNYCAYKLEGWDEDWIIIKQLRRITYSNIPSGEYTLRVKSSSKEGEWLDNETSMTIHILPPPYLTKSAFLIYVILTITLSYLIYKRFVKLTKSRQEKILNLIQQKKNKELYDAKIMFFTNITHEIRTPLSLIKMPLEEIMKKIKKSDEFYDNLSIIQKNTDRLLKLVNELLDFRRVEAKDIKVSYTHVGLIGIIHKTVKRFKPSAEIQNIVFIEELPEEELFADVDIEIFTKILSNLLNNALKHASTFIKIHLCLKEENFHLEISNDGEKIPKEQSERIFEPFVKLDEKSLGAGIGLAFVRSLVKSHNGNIYVDTERDDVTFIITMPVAQAFSISVGKDEIPEILPETITVEVKQEENNRKVILLVEDNLEFLQFMTKQLQEDYQIIRATNGTNALKILSTQQIDLVISDIMMPVMDGMTLCKEIKENIKFSHIPIILLSAKMDLHARLDGMKVGADEYIVKPYSIDYLKVRIENLINNRNRIKEAYQHSPESTISELSHSKADEEFLNKLVEKIHQHLNEDELNVDSLAQMMNMSRATLYRKLKNISELTPNEFIRLIRLKKAAELLKQKEYRINEIIYIIGFSSVSYFCKCFQKQFGVSPKEYHNKIIGHRGGVIIILIVMTMKINPNNHI